MSSLLLRDVRLVPLRPGDVAPAGPVDVAVTGGRVSAVVPTGGSVGGHIGGLLDELLGRGDVEEVDGAGRWLLPGLWDQHVHAGQWALSSARLDLSRVASVSEAVERARAQLGVRPDLPVVGWGHRPTAWDVQPTTADLDRLDTHQPVVLIAGDGHHAWLNTVALDLLGLTRRDGVVAEGEWFAAYARLGPILGQEGTGPDAYRRTMEAAAGKGVVGFVDFEFSGGVADWLGRWREGADRLRVRMATYAAGLDDVIAYGLRTGDPLDPAGDQRLTMGPLKIISDGSLNTRTAWCCDPYAVPPPTGPAEGEPNQTTDELHGLLARAVTHDLRVAVHAIGDRAVVEALDAFEATGARGSVEHAQLTTRRDVRRMAGLGVRASVQPAHLLDDRDVSERLWPGRGGRSFALRWLLDEGVDMVLGSDAPVSPLDPWLAISAAVHRSDDLREPWHPEQAITAREALAASTDGWGMVAAGHPGDLVLLDADPLAGADDRDHAARLLAMADAVAAAWVAGRRVHGPAIL